MRGEDIQGLNIEELMKLEKMLEAGLSRVIKSKVLHPFTPAMHNQYCTKVFKYNNMRFFLVVLGWADNDRGYHSSDKGKQTSILFLYSDFNCESAPFLFLFSSKEFLMY